MRYFTADTHFGDERLNLFQRDFVAENGEEMDNIIIDAWNKTVTDDDTVYHCGDVAYTGEGLKKLSLLNGKKILIRGNYDQQFTQEELLEYFDEVYDSMIIYIDEEPVYLNHYPTECDVEKFNIVGHIHGLWKVQRNMINVGCDAWHFLPVSEDSIKFTMTAIRKYYDENVFAGELEQNRVDTK